MAQVDEIGEPCVAVLHERLDDLDHLQEGDRALLHPRAARHRGGDEGDPFRRRPFHSPGQSLCGRDPERAPEERELAGDNADAPALDGPLAGDHGLVDTGGLAGLVELCPVLGAGRDRDEPGVPAHEAVVVENLGEQLAGADAPLCRGTYRACVTAADHLGDLALYGHVRGHRAP